MGGRWVTSRIKLSVQPDSNPQSTLEFKLDEGKEEYKNTLEEVYDPKPDKGQEGSSDNQLERA